MKNYILLFSIGLLALVAGCSGNPASKGCPGSSKNLISFLLPLASQNSGIFINQKTYQSRTVASQKLLASDPKGRFGKQDSTEFEIEAHCREEVQLRDSENGTFSVSRLTFPSSEAARTFANLEKKRCLNRIYDAKLDKGISSLLWFSSNKTHFSIWVSCANPEPRGRELATGIKSLLENENLEFQVCR